MVDINEMDQNEIFLMNRIQEDFPLVSRPYLEIATQLGMNEAEVIELIKQLREQGYIRRLGGFFDSRRLGYVSTLCAMKVPEARIHETAEIINSYVGVTHNYIRNHEMNMWFTLTAESKDKMEQILDEIKAKTDMNDILLLKATKTHKIKVHLCI